MNQSNKLKIKSYICSLIIFEILFIIYNLAFAQSAKAQTMENSMYKIQMGNLNSFSGESSGSNYNISITSGENAPGFYSGTNYSVGAGFQYVPRGIPFRFSISNTLIDFGILTPTNPVLRTTNLIVSNSTAQSYKVMAAENTPLMDTKTGAVIPDSTCDDGTCTQNRSARWSNTLTYGFGYRCDGSNNLTCIPTDSSFSDKKYYKQFADSSKKETAVTVMSGGRGTAQNSTITYKVNISSSQPSGLFTNEITYLAVPSY
jgi:hypothetical protein